MWNSKTETTNCKCTVLLSRAQPITLLGDPPLNLSPSVGSPALTSSINESSEEQNKNIAFPPTKNAPPFNSTEEADPYGYSFLFSYKCIYPS